MSNPIKVLWDRTVLDGCIWVTLHIHIDIECLDEDHDGLVGDGVHGSGVSHFVSVSALAGGFLSIEHCILPS